MASLIPFSAAFQFQVDLFWTLRTRRFSHPTASFSVNMKAIVRPFEGKRQDLPGLHIDEV